MRVTPGAIPLLEDAVHLLRRTPLATLLCHLVGTAPFALAVLLFWNDVNNAHTADSTVARESVVLSLLLVWMNCWRAVFAGRLRRQLSAIPDTAWTWSRAWNLFAAQAFLGATKLVALPLALLTLFPFAWTVAFYRSATALADRPDLDPLQLIARARHLAGLDRRQSWAVLPILAFLGLAFIVNLGLTLALLPQLILMLTGYESQFARSGPYFIFTPLFLWATLAISWMAFDPFMQAVYCLRCFHGESITTGEDIRAGLRTLTAMAAVLMVLLPFHGFAATSPASARDLEPSVRRAMQSPEYDWRLPVPATAAPQEMPWIVRVTDRLIDGLKSIFRAIGKAIDDFIDWLRDLFGMKTGPSGGALPTAGLHWGLYLLIGFVVVLTAWIAWRRRWFHSVRPPAATVSSLAAVRLDDAGLTADRLPEERWLDLAARSLAEGNFRFALRAYYLANLAWLGRSEPGRGQFLTIHPGKTNREYELELRRKVRSFTEARSLFAANIAAFERAWYGLHEVSAGDASEFHQRSQQIKVALAAPRGAAA